MSETSNVSPIGRSPPETADGVEAASVVPAVALLPNAARDLALAMVAASPTPLVLLDGQLAIVAISTSFSRAFDVDADTARGLPLAALGNGEWAGRQLDGLLRTTLNGETYVEAYEMELVRPGQDPRCLCINATLLDYGVDTEPRVALAVTDVTEVRADAKAKEELIREKAVLLQELQHRVANSLQIIASVLMQSARRVQSDEARGHLESAHSRLMSVAAVQSQLARTQLGDVAIRVYIDDLCRSIGASMIADPAQLSIVTQVDDLNVRPDVSVSMGLVVTELIVNALKHAFPEHRRGTILVEYHVGDSGWTLSVSDDGIGMHAKAGPLKAGLGTSLIEALARQLRATIRIEDARPGTRVNIEHARAVGAVPALRVV